MGIFNAATTRDVDALRARIGRLEALVELLARHQGISEHEISQIMGSTPAVSSAPYAEGAPGAPYAEGAAVSARVRQLMIEGKKIQAIKVHREETGLGLKEAKDAVEAL